MSYFCSIQWLKQQVDCNQPIVIVDCRYDLMDEDAGELAYRQGHIPNAHYANLSLDLSDACRPDGVGGRHPLPNPERFVQYLSEVGITENSIVVAYDDQGGAMASRLRWLLQWVGHSGDVFVLEEGFKGWKEAGYAVTTDIPKRTKAALYPVKLQYPMLVDHLYVSSRLGQESTVIIDSRDPARYRGEVEPIDQKAGHIPTAINHFWQEGKRADGTWKSAEEQAERFKDIDKEKEVIVYCGSGVTATPNFFALQEAGFKNVKLYAGSWSEWSSLPDKPVATGVE